jgi:DNA invertase Pin-like site-specific DNA recombinase
MPSHPVSPPRTRRASRAEKRCGATTEGREALRTVLEFLHAGDVLMVTRIDRLAGALETFRTSFALSGRAARS